MTESIPHSPSLRASDLCELLESYLPAEQVREIYRAFLFSAEAHDGQIRESGEAYISHPLAVAGILAEMRLDKTTLIAALLHDVIEDTKVDKALVAEEFGQQVAELVDGVSKLKHLGPGSGSGSESDPEQVDKAKLKAASLQKMLMAMTQDVRVIIVKLADRLHNMRTLGAKKPTSRRRIGRETLEIYAPIASRLGMGQMALELEDMGFAALYPWRSRVLRARIDNQHERHKEQARVIHNAIQARLLEAGINAEILLREKHTYRVYIRIRNKKMRFKTQQDTTLGFRVIVDNQSDTCYRVLGIIHNLYKPRPGSFKDYIAIPKANYYQSLHTDVIGPKGIKHISIQIRTHDMHQFAELGIISSNLYRACEETSSERRRAGDWFRTLLDMQRTASSPMEFLESVKRDLFPDEIYIFTPKGDIVELPRNATVVDFAYTLDANIGNHLIAAKVDDHLVSLDKTLMTGQRVEAITANWASPRMEWLDIAVSGKARSHIRSFLKNVKREKATALGARILERELQHYEMSLETLTETQRQALICLFKFSRLEDLLEDIGLGNLLAYGVARQLALSEAVNRYAPPSNEQIENSTEPASPGSAVVQEEQQPLSIRGAEGMLINFAKCCHPIPGDPIYGYITPGKGMMVHRQTCHNALRGQNTENWVNLGWDSNPEAYFSVEIRIDVLNKRGALAVISQALTNLDIDIDHVFSVPKDGLSYAIQFGIQVKGRKHLATLMRHLRRIDIVTRIQRRP